MTFPVLKTAAVAQYPLGHGLRFSTLAVPFLDGSRQNFRLYGGGLRRWTVRLDLLDEQELGELIGFAEAQGGAPFAYVDPLTGTTAARCVISGDKFAAAMTGELDGQAQLVIEEIP